MGDGDDRAGVVVQVPLEPRDALGVEVVGGLVEEQHVAGERTSVQCLEDSGDTLH